MFRFEHPGFFWLAGLVALLVVIFYSRGYLVRKGWSRWGSESSNQKVVSVRDMQPRWMWFGLAALLLLSIAATNPQWGFRTVAVESKSADVYLALDISNSMLAEDIAPSRLERAKRIALDLSSAFKTDRVGLILFAGNAYIQSPLTTDWHAIQLFLNAAHPDQAGTQGTAIGEAIRLVLKPKSGEAAAHGALIILTDGEDHDSDAPAAVADAVEAGWTTYIIGVGTETGSTIPMAIDGVKDVKRDESGQPVKTALNRSLMMDLAGKGNGKYFDASSGTGIVESLTKELAGLERTQSEKRSFSEHKSYFQWFLLPALFLLLLLVVRNYKFDVI
ncbi:MAG: VWA domain-containing protein [Saprospiraceae bacterium]|nr:VWA domain-containing protein [Candidatus Opimibacter iunctus]